MKRPSAGLEIPKISEHTDGEVLFQRFYFCTVFNVMNMERPSQLLGISPVARIKLDGDDKQLLLRQEIEQNVRALKDARELYGRMSAYVNRTFLNVEQWSKQELMEWFFQQGKPEYAALASHNQLDGRAVLCLNWEDCVMRLGLLLPQAFAFYDYVKLLQVRFYQPLMLVAPAKQVKHRIDVYERYLALAERLEPSASAVAESRSNQQHSDSDEVRTPREETGALALQSAQVQCSHSELPNGTMLYDSDRPTDIDEELFR